ncbi:hypothetical protein DL96DRAFT_1553689 [Flagelloscypha sp. PMI_526]|nr:hypothetical protein DL96DRAFT_1553689 [Flagelloscypha sp. PMI_526]
MSEAIYTNGKRLLRDTTTLASPHPSKRSRHKTILEDEVESNRTAHLQAQSALLHTLPTEVLDSIILWGLGVESTLIILHSLEHAPSSVWDILSNSGSLGQAGAIRDSSFTVALLLDPCNLSQCLTTPVLPSTHDTARSRIFSTANGSLPPSLTGTPGIKLDAKCANISHERKKDCGCLRFIGPAHGKVSLSALIDPVQANFRSVLSAEDKNREEPDRAKHRRFCLAAVDAAIWNAAGGAAGVKGIWERQIKAEARGEYQPIKWDTYSLRKVRSRVRKKS